jgi:hypothetical protein
MNMPGYAISNKYVAGTLKETMLSTLTRSPIPNDAGSRVAVGFAIRVGVAAGVSLGIAIGVAKSAGVLQAASKSKAVNASSSLKAPP